MRIGGLGARAEMGVACGAGFGQIPGMDKGRKDTTENPNARYERGAAKLREIHGEKGEKVVESLAEVSPALARLLFEFPFGDVYSRPGLDLKSRQIATVASLITLGNAQAQLEVHMHGALNVGCTRTEIVELVIQMAVYAGFPAALNGMSAARAVFSERDARGVRDSS